MNATVKAKISAELKLQAENTLREVGLDMTSAIRIFLTQVVNTGGIPFEVRVAQPNRATLAAISDSYSGKTERANSVDALFADAAN
ncbi:MAG: type II toxin-antitoxin system RelB/DinJ family antitoxin [Xanthomonadales bacterium]|nr:type II toxin-antitoxin system RelB/DinJ family antitoxin [Xanthomonadales bacterium]